MLKDVVEHVQYEIDSLTNTAYLLTKYQVLFSTTVTNALVTAFVIHARVLTDFFYRKSRHKNDVNAWDYCDEWKQGVLVAHGWAERPEVLTGLWDEASQRAAHLSTIRVHIQREGGWKIAEICDQLLCDARDFAAMAAKSGWQFHVS